ncbi:MAG TPA: hypothetical protein VN442_21995 [Bryobacteraceae bacterium]|nr:hypothetical protein [Bryobacteraceae bacterium]
MSGRSERFRTGLAILLLVTAAAVAPLVDEIVGFLSEAPYVQFLPVVERGDPPAALRAGVLTSGLRPLTIIPHDD